MKVYISGRITGLDRDEARAAFAAAADHLASIGHEPVNPFDIPNPAGCGCPGDPGPYDSGHTWVCCLRKDVEVIASSCDAIAMLPGWESSRGAMFELNVALTLGLRVFFPFDVTEQPDAA